MVKKSLQKHIQLLFEGVEKKPSDSWPERGALSKSLNDIYLNQKDDYSLIVDRSVVNNYAKAAIEMWHRSVHSFLISASLTELSPIWASVSGYYSSHYSIRAFAHLLGYFQLFRHKKIVRLEINGGKYVCHFEKKDGQGREHKCYWKKVKEEPLFKSDSFFTENEESRDDINIPSDVMHRDRANYWDLIDGFTSFKIMEKEYLKKRIREISTISLSVAPIPSAGAFPDIYKVQLIAYHRMVRFRLFLDEILIRNRFWLKHRTPDWCGDFLNFQITQPESLTLINNLKSELSN